MKLSPPSPSALAIPEADARKAAEAIFGPDAISSMQPKLAIMNDNTRGQIQGDGSVRLDYVNRLVWAYVGYGPCATDNLSGMIGTNASTVVPTPSPGLTCIGVVTVDAQTGKYLEGYTEAANAASMTPNPSSTLKPLMPSTSKVT